jgi:hypothetical protein
MNEEIKNACACNPCVGASCGCGCQDAAASQACACGPECRCGDACGCGEVKANA